MGSELRSNPLFDTDEWPVFATAARKPFKFYLRQTPAAPLSSATKLLLWAAGAMVAAVLIAMLLRTARLAHSHPAPDARIMGNQ
ncbi:MAG TPA: hypothetical protein VGZ22_14900 [Isosphaeraceae bacterium]|nr:hypothetical protein [Isosphaeraceae bacterium]